MKTNVSEKFKNKVTLLFLNLYNERKNCIYENEHEKMDGAFVGDSIALFSERLQKCRPREERGGDDHTAGRRHYSRCAKQRHGENYLRRHSHERCVGEPRHSRGNRVRFSG